VTSSGGDAGGGYAPSLVVSGQCVRNCSTVAPDAVDGLAHSLLLAGALLVVLLVALVLTHRLVLSVLPRGAHE